MNPAIKRIILLFVTICIAIGYLIFNALISHISIDIAVSIVDLFNIAVGYASLFITILLGIIVYFQSERINNLEASQYDIFLGVEKIDPTLSLSSELTPITNNQLRSSDNVKVFKTIIGDESALFTHIHIHDTATSVQIPFVFITRNTPLITSFDLNKIQLQLDICPNGIVNHYKHSFDIDTDPTYRFLTDQSHFVVFLNLHGIALEDVIEIKVLFYLTVSDQLNRTPGFVSEVTLLQIDGNFRLTSSKTTRQQGNNTKELY